MRFLTMMTILFIVFPSFGAQKKTDTKAIMAKATASFVNRMSNVEEFLSVLSRSVSAEQMDNLKKQLSLNGVQGKDKFPKMKFDGNKVYFDKQNYIMYVDENTIKVNGVEFKRSVKGIDVVYKEIMAAIGKKSASHFGIIPEAHAIGTLGGILGLVAGGGIGYFLGPSLGISAGWGAVLGAGAFFLGNELYQSWRSGEVSCDAYGNYMYRSKTRDGLGGLFAGSQTNAMDPATLGQAFGGQGVPPCNPASAKMAQQGIKNYGVNPQPLGYPPYQQAVTPGAYQPQPQPADVTVGK